MTEILEPVTLDETQRQEFAARLVAQAREAGVELVGPGGPLTGLTKQVLETALEEELTEHLGYEPGDRQGKQGRTSGTGPGPRRC